MNAVVDDARWQRRATRARRLADERPAVAEALNFYADLAEMQESLVRRFPQLISTPSSTFADRLDAGAALKALPEVIAFVQRKAPAAIASTPSPPPGDELDRWLHRIHTYWITGGREAWDAGPVQRLILEILLTPFAETATGPAPGMTSRDDRAARLSPNFTAGAGPVAGSALRGGRSCEVCTGLPVVALLREQGHGAKRSLVCGLCLTEWSSPRLECLHCGETTFEALPVFRSGEFDAVRIDACDSCQSYVKTIDLTRDGDASPIVDDIASLPLDLWAREKGYRRIRPNLFGY